MAVEPLTLRVAEEDDGVLVCVSLKPELQCYCLEHDWYLRIEGPGGVSQEWRWRSRSDSEGYRSLAMKWKPPARGRYRVVAELVSHGYRLEGSFSFKPRILLAFYSRTGVTRALAAEVAESLRGLGADVDVREIRVRREYSKPLHLNPRLIFDTFLGRADIIVDFDPCAYDAYILASPIWAGRPAAPVAAFLKTLLGKCEGKPAACFTTSIMSADYSVKLARLAEEAGLRVVYRANAPGGRLKVDFQELLRALQT